MAQVTIYLPDELERALKKRAARAKKSLSAYITELAGREIRPTKWPPDFDDLYGSWEGPFPEIEDPPPTDVAPL